MDALNQSDDCRPAVIALNILFIVETDPDRDRQLAEAAERYGNAVVISARLEANAPAGTIYISRAVADALEGRIRVASLGDSVKRKEKQAGFEVLIMDEILSEPLDKPLLIS